MGVFNGSDLLIFNMESELPIACQLSVNFSFQDDGIDITCKQSEGFKEIMAGKRTFTCSGEALTDWVATEGTSEVMDFYTTRTQIEINVCDPTNEDVYFTGFGYFDSIEMNAGTEDAPTYTFSISGTGDFESLVS